MSTALAAAQEELRTWRDLMCARIDNLVAALGVCDQVIALSYPEPVAQPIVPASIPVRKARLRVLSAPTPAPAARAKTPGLTTPGAMKGTPGPVAGRQDAPSCVRTGPGLTADAVAFEKVWDGMRERAGQAPILSSVSIAREAR